MPQVSFYTTALRPDDKLRLTHDSLQRSGVSFEHVVTVARDFGRASIFLPQDTSNLTLISTPGAGISEGFNRAIRNCTGSYLMAMNCGDTILDARPLAEALDRKPALDFAYGDIRYGQQVVKAKPSPITERDCLLHAMGFCHGAAMTRRDFHEKFGFYEAQFRLAMDFALYFAAVRGGARMAYVPHVVAAIEPGGLSSRILARTRENYRILRRKVSPLVAFPIAVKWYLASLLAENLARLKP